MSNPAVNLQGTLVVAGSRVTVHGAVTTIAGSGVGRPALTAMVTDAVVVTTTLGEQVELQAGDCHAVVEPRTGNDARSTDGFAIALNDQVIFNGLVTAKTDSPWGINGQLTVLTDFSGSSVVVSSGTVDNG
jgi:ribosomal protein L14